jgi:hypothetical protein
LDKPIAGGDDKESGMPGPNDSLKVESKPHGVRLGLLWVWISLIAIAIAVATFVVIYVCTTPR